MQAVQLSAKGKNEKEACHLRRARHAHRCRGGGRVDLDRVRDNNRAEAHVRAPDTERQNVDLKPQGPSIGDLFVFAGPLNNTSGDEAGRLDGHCVTTSVPSDDPETHRRQCFVTATIGTENGETEIELQGVGRILAEDVLLGVSGGTGRFQNARGQALLDFTTPGQVSLRFALIP